MIGLPNDVAMILSVLVDHCENCGGKMRMTAAACGGPFDSYHERMCFTCGRVERDGWGPRQVRTKGLPRAVIERRRQQATDAS